MYSNLSFIFYFPCLLIETWLSDEINDSENLFGAPINVLSGSDRACGQHGGLTIAYGVPSYF